MCHNFVTIIWMCVHTSVRQKCTHVARLPRLFLCTCVMHGERPCDIHTVWWHYVHASCQALWTAARCRGSGDMLLVSQARWGWLMMALEVVV